MVDPIWHNDAVPVDDHWTAHFNSLWHVQPAQAMTEEPKRVNPQPHLYTTGAAPAHYTYNPMAQRGYTDAIAPNRNAPYEADLPYRAPSKQAGNGWGRADQRPPQWTPVGQQQHQRETYRGGGGSTAGSAQPIYSPEGRQVGEMTYRQPKKPSPLKQIGDFLRDTFAVDSTRGMGQQNTTRLFQAQ